MESPSSWTGQFHTKKASRVPKSQGLSLCTIEWSCPRIVNETSLFDEIRVKPYLIQRGKTQHKETHLKASGAQIELRISNKHNRDVLIGFRSRNKQGPLKVINTC